MITVMICPAWPAGAGFAGHRWLFHYHPLRQAIEYITQAYGEITNREYQELGKVSHEMAHRELSELTAKGLIEKRGAGRGTHYILVDDQLMISDD